ncbi:cation:H+ antiporter [Ruminococcaceae bacterium YRB3002]|nr:cation:H+ antiporter [Ruminococcaceae bacterium YRB3002]
MEIAFNLVLLIACFAILIKGADFLVDAASYIAAFLGVPSLIIGLTIVAFGTSCPEAGVSIVSSMAGNNSLSISNVVGSNAFNLLVVVGLTAVIGTVAAPKDLMKLDFPICLFFSALLIFSCWDLKFTRIEGIIYVASIIAYCVFLIIRSRKGRSADNNDDIPEPSKPRTGKGSLLRVLIIVVAIAAIYLSSRGIVHSCTFFAKLFGISDTVIGLTIVALGTSLPELVTSLVAYKKGENSIALGNIIGSNLFNILFVLGIAGAISPLDLLRENVTDTIICLAVTVLTFVFAVTGKKINRVEGVVMLLVYAGYMAFVFLREFNVIAI